MTKSCAVSNSPLITSVLGTLIVLRRSMIVQPSKILIISFTVRIDVKLNDRGELTVKRLRQLRLR